MVEARTLSRDNAAELALWCGGRVVVQHDALDHDLTIPGVNVLTCEGVKRAQVGDTVIWQNDGSFRIVRPNEVE